MAIADIPVGIDAIDVQLQLTGGVRPVHQHRHTVRAAQRRDAGHRKLQRRGRCDVVDHDQPGPRPDPRRHSIGDLRRAGDRQPDLGLHKGCTGLIRNMAQGVPHRAVRVVRAEDLVAWGKAQRPHHRVDAGGGVGDEGQAVGLGPHEPGQRDRRLPQQGRQFLHEEPRGVGFHPVPPRRLLGHDLPRCGAERPVIEKPQAVFDRPKRT